MSLNLQKPICIFDLETTGVNTAKDRIVEIAIIRVEPDGTEITKTWRVDPEMHIPEQASKIHGIYDEDVADEPTFKLIEIIPDEIEILSEAEHPPFEIAKEHPV
jgi:DNA polymerase-3 subunit epsilon